MKALKELLSELTFTCERGNLEKEITAVVYDSRKIVEGCLFVCIKGANFDGHQAAAEAAEKKAGQNLKIGQKIHKNLVEGAGADENIDDNAVCLIGVGGMDHIGGKDTQVSLAHGKLMILNILITTSLPDKNQFKKFMPMPVDGTVAVMTPQDNVSTLPEITGFRGDAVLLPGMSRERVTSIPEEEGKFGGGFFIVPAAVIAGIMNGLIVCLKELFHWVQFFEITVSESHELHIPSKEKTKRPKNKPLYFILL